MAGIRISLLAATAAAAALALSACDNGPSAVAQRQGGSQSGAQQAAGEQMASNTERAPERFNRDDRGDGADAGVDHRQDPVPTLDGKPLWSASRQHSARENAERAFARNGEAFGADNLNAFVGKAHAFVEHPPKGALTLARANGDTLIYDPKANVFAVRSKAGAPRTMFKPEDGMAYWQKQKARETQRQTARGGRGREDEA